MAESVTVNVRLDPEELLGDVDRWADVEHRSRSQMIRVLLLEALAERQRIDRARINQELKAQAGTRAARLLLPSPDDHQFKSGKNPLKCETCGMKAADHR